MSNQTTDPPTLSQLLGVPFLNGELFLVLQTFSGFANLDFELLPLLLLQVVELLPALSEVVLECVGHGEPRGLFPILTEKR